MYIDIGYEDVANIGFFGYAQMLGIGLFIGVILLPFRYSLSSSNTIQFLLLWAVFWPFLVLYGIKKGVFLYTKAWWKYQDRVMFEKNHKAKSKKN
jgi:hypothetical protein